MNYELNMILEKVKCDFVCVYEGESKLFSSKAEFEQSDMDKNCIVSSISAKDGTIVLEFLKWESPKTDMDADWVKEHEKQFGKKPSFF